MVRKRSSVGISRSMLAIGLGQAFCFVAHDVHYRRPMALVFVVMGLLFAVTLLLAQGYAEVGHDQRG
jgi:hypothetical protein